MNNKIYELAKQAGLIEFETIPGSNAVTPDYESVVKAKKFAELIVRECVQVCADRGKHHDGLYSVWADDCSKRIGKHFGVEE